jgi:hypothetical protein
VGSNTAVDPVPASRNDAAISSSPLARHAGVRFIAATIRPVPRDAISTPAGRATANHTFGKIEPSRKRADEASMGNVKDVDVATNQAHVHPFTIWRRDRRAIS